MKQPKELILFFLIFSVFISCTSTILPHKTKADIQKEFKENYFYDPHSLTGFRKDWNWTFYSRADAKAEMKGVKENIDSFLKLATPIYAAKRRSSDNTRENVIVFHFDTKGLAQNFLSNHFTFIDSLYRNIDYSLKNFEDREVKMYYSHDRRQKLFLLL